MTDEKRTKPSITASCLSLLSCCKASGPPLPLLVIKICQRFNHLFVVTVGQIPWDRPFGGMTERKSATDVRNEVSCSQIAGAAASIEKYSG